MPIEQARAQGAMALFGEKYPDIVRVVQMGDFSRELCGGTHLDSVGQVGLFKIVGEESVAAGTRRITALTGKAALDYVRQEEEILGRARRDAPRPARPGRPARRRAARGDQDAQEAGEPAAPRGRGGRLRRRPARPRPRRSAGAAVIVRAVGGDLGRRDAAARSTSCGASVRTKLAVLLASTADDKVQLVAGLSRRPGRGRAARRELAQGGRADRRRRRRRTARPGPGRRQGPRPGPGRAGEGRRGHPCPARALNAP